MLTKLISSFCQFPGPKDGLCELPVEGVNDRCVQDCSRDNECEDETKCCFNGCGNVCAAPEWGCKFVNNI